MAIRYVTEREGKFRQKGVAADAVCENGNLAVLNAGFLEPGSVAEDLVCIGIFEDPSGVVDNTGGDDGDVSARVRAGIFPFANSAGADEITDADIESLCYIAGPATVALTDGTGTRSVAGVIHDIDSRGVWVRVGLGT